MRRLVTRTFLLLALLASSVLPCAAAEGESAQPPAAPPAGQAPAPAGQGAAPAPPLTWSLFGEARFRPEYRDNFDLDAAVDDAQSQGFMRLRLGVRLAFKDDYRLVMQIQDSRVAGQEATTASNEKNLDLHQGYVDVAVGKSGVSFAIGRQEWFYGDHRMIGNFGWDNVGRSFDGVKVRYARDRFFIDGLLAQITERTTPIAAPVSSASTAGSTLYGAYAQWAPRPASEYEAYLLGFDDHIAAAGEITGTSGATTVHALGGRIRDRFGRVDLKIEAAVERGEYHGDDLKARAAGLIGGVNFGRETKTRLLFGYDYATGDKDGTDGRREEFFNFFPTNHPHYGTMDMFGWRNIDSPWVGVSVAKGRHFAQAAAHRFGLEQAGGEWKDAGGTVLGSDPSGNAGTDVGLEIDLTYRFDWTPKAALEVGLSRFDPREFADATRGSDASQWGYVMVTFGL
jgi:hypothetical protein